MSDWDDRQRIGGLAIGSLTPEYLHWARRGETPVTVALTTAFALFTIGWTFLIQSSSTALMHWDRVQAIYQHFVLDPGDLSSGRWHVLFSHAFLYDDLIHLIFMLLGLLVFGAAVEGRNGSTLVAVVFFSAVALGGYLQLQINDPAQFREWTQFLGSKEITQLLGSTRNSEINTFQGPSAGVWALMAMAALQDPRKRSRKANIQLAGFAVVFLLADWGGFFHFHQTVGYVARFVGLLVGIGFGVLKIACVIRPAFSNAAASMSDRS